VQRLPAALTQTDAAAHAVCAAQHACAFFAAVVRESQLHMRGASPCFTLKRTASQASLTDSCTDTFYTGYANA